MVVQSRRMTLEEFDQFVALPENAARNFEYIAGDVVEMVSNQRSSAAASRLNTLIGIYVLQHRVGFTTTTDGGYVIAGERYIPDVAFVSYQRQPEPSDEAYSSIPPDLAVEVLSPSNSEKDMRTKVVNYLSVGTVVWVVDPEFKLVEVYTPGQAVKKVRLDETLDGGNVLPGFTLAVKDIFQA